IRLNSEHSKVELGRLAHEVGPPRRIPEDLHLDVTHALDGEHRLAHPLRDLAGDGTAGSVQLSADSDIATLREINDIDQAEVKDIDRNFRVIDLAQRRDQRGFQIRAGGAFLVRAGRARAFDFIKSRHDYSVVTSSSLSMADVMACQARVAHLTRMGNSRTPASIISFSLASPASIKSSSPFTSLRKPAKSSRASSTDLPLMISVIIEAEASEMAQPLPSKAASSISPSGPRVR